MFNNRLVRMLLNINFDRFTHRTQCSCHELDPTTRTQVYQIDIFSNSAAFEILCINANTVDRISINSNDKFLNVVSFLALALSFPSMLMMSCFVIDGEFVANSRCSCQNPVENDTIVIIITIMRRRGRLLTQHIENLVRKIRIYFWKSF